MLTLRNDFVDAAISRSLMLVKTWIFILGALEDSSLSVEKPMILRRQTTRNPQPSAMLAILWGGLVCGVLDITAAIVVYGFFGIPPIRLLQGIASGLLGPRALAGGLTTAALGLLCHFLIAFSAAAVYVATSRFVGFLVQHAVLSGILYGVAVYFFMNRIVLPLSAARRYPFSVKMMIVGTVIHIFCVGLPISLTARRFSRNVRHLYPTRARIQSIEAK